MKIAQSSLKLFAGRTSTILIILVSSQHSAEVPVTLEPMRIFWTDGKRPDSIMLVPRQIGTWLSRVHWLSHTLTEPLLRQVQQQRWQPLAMREIRRLRCSLRLWTNCGRDLASLTPQLATYLMTLEVGFLETRMRRERLAFCAKWFDLDIDTALQCCPSIWQFAGHRTNRLMIICTNNNKQQILFTRSRKQNKCKMIKLKLLLGGYQIESTAACVTILYTNNWKKILLFILFYNINTVTHAI